MEFYEYQIHKYKPLDRFNNFTKEKNNVYKFGDLDDSPESPDECNRVGIEGSYLDVTDDTQRTSCDPLTSLSGGDQNKILKLYSTYDIENLYNNYKEFFAKYEVQDVLNERSIRKINENLDNAIINQLKQITNLINKNSKGNDLFKKYIELSEINTDINILIKHNKSDSLLFNLDINKDTKIILFGDFHGSFHTFFRLLCRLHKYNIINLDTFEINNPYKIIFLGDVLDRGMYSLDIINIIFKLIAINNKDELKIIYNRGNHETYNIFERDGAFNEFKNKFSNNKDAFDNFIIKYIRLLNLSPSAIILNCKENNNNNNYFWCSHGGFPKEYINIKLDLTNKIIFFSDIISTDIRWSDFGGNSLDDYVQSSRGENIVKYTHIGTNKFLNTNDIKFIIRGHQDSTGNSFIFYKDGSPIVISDPLMTDINNFLYYNKSLKKYGNRVNGPIARLKLDKNNANNYFPVITISTNTDTRRYLNSDSFALLRFDIEECEDKNFKGTLNSINKINTVLKNKNINISSIFINNMKIINNILNLIDNDTYYLFNYYYNLDNNNNNNYNTFSILIFIDDIFNDCVEFVDYYKQKYNNLFQKINELKNNLIIDEIQINSVDNYLKSYNEYLILNNLLIDKIRNNKNKTFKTFDTFDTFDTINTLSVENLKSLKDNILEKYILFNKYNDA